MTQHIEGAWSLDRWIIDGMKRMLKDGVVTVDMSFSDVQKICDEPDVHEFDIGIMMQNWDEAKQEFRREMMPLRVTIPAITKEPIP